MLEVKQLGYSNLLLGYLIWIDSLTISLTVLYKQIEGLTLILFSGVRAAFNLYAVLEIIPVEVGEVRIR